MFKLGIRILALNNTFGFIWVHCIIINVLDKTKLLSILVHCFSTIDNKKKEVRWPVCYSNENPAQHLAQWNFSAKSKNIMASSSFKFT